jgi:ribonucleoside-diphosphate reductase beta chain
MATEGTRLQLDRDSKGTHYYRNAVERHWDPFDIDIEDDGERLAAYLRKEDTPAEAFDMFRQSVARFGAGEQAVTEDLAPLATALDDVDDQMFITTQLYEEAKHTDFFDRYWRTVVNPVEEQLGRGRSSPTEQRWFNDAYDELFERNERAMHRLLEDRSPEAFAEAYAHYHLVIEGILAQTGYYGMQQSFAENRNPELPHLPGLYDGFVHIRQDEGRHVGFGMAKLKSLVSEGQIDPQLLDDTVSELMPLVNEIAASPEEISGDRGVQPEELQRFASEKHLDRMEQIQDVSAELPDVETLTKLEGD